MIETMQSINYVLALAGLVCMLVIAFLIYDMQTQRRLRHLVAEWGMRFALITTIGAVSLTLVYSEYFGLIPCGLCWLERMALYPQVLLIAGALYFKEKHMPPYGIMLSGFGIIVSAYHHYIQMGGSQFVKCPTAGAGADCAKRFFFEFGFMTFPFLSVILFVFLAVVYTYILKTRTETI